MPYDLFIEIFKHCWFPMLLIIAFKILGLFVPAIRGRIGEGRVNRAAKLRLDPQVYRMIMDVTIPSRNGTTQIDHVIASIYGLFVIETKNYSGWIFGDAKSRKWTRVNFKQKHRFQNPLHQNHAHVCALSDLLGISNDRIHGVVCFMGSAEFKKGIPGGIFIRDSFVSHIKSFNIPVFSESEVSDIIQQIESRQLKRGFKTNREHVRQLKKKHASSGHHPVSRQRSSAARSSSQPSFVSVFNRSPNKTCPRCGETMVLRTAKQGTHSGNQFWGCSAYPKCRMIQPV